MVIENTHEPIVDSDIFYRVQELIEEARQKYHDGNGILNGYQKGDQ